MKKLKRISIEQNKRILLTTVIILGIVSLVRLSSLLIGGSFDEFCEAAYSWTLMGIAIAVCCACLSVKE